MGYVYSIMQNNNDVTTAAPAVVTGFPAPNGFTLSRSPMFKCSEKIHFLHTRNRGKADRQCPVKGARCHAFVKQSRQPQGVGTNAPDSFEPWRQCGATFLHHALHFQKKKKKKEK